MRFPEKRFESRFCFMPGCDWTPTVEVRLKGHSHPVPACPRHAHLDTAGIVTHKALL